jgi:5-methylcytosine-specific restriction protein A
LIKAKKICNKCRKVKGLSCSCIEPKKYEGIKQNNYSLYNSRKWRKFSHQLRKDNPLCKMCLDEGRTYESQMVDHIREINKGGSIWDINNLQCLCNKCHSKKSGRGSKK